MTRAMATAMNGSARNSRARRVGTAGAVRDTPGVTRALPVALLALAAGCALHAAPLPADHPANASAPTGRLADAPAALRPGVAAYDGLPIAPAVPAPTDAPAHHHHH